MVINPLRSGFLFLFAACLSGCGEPPSEDLEETSAAVTASNPVPNGYFGKATVRADDALNLRSEPRISPTNIVGSLPGRTEVYLDSVAEGWAKITGYSGCPAGCYASARYLQRDMNVAPFSIILLPDTQHYTEFGRDYGAGTFRGPYHKQTEWIVDNWNDPKHNIQFVVHLGDLTDNNKPEEWKIAQEAHSLLDKAKGYDSYGFPIPVPYSVSPGNHDFHPCEKGDMEYGLDGWYATSCVGKSKIGTYFGRKSWYGGCYPSDKSCENNYSFFDAGNLKFMVVSLEHDPTLDHYYPDSASGLMDWAKEAIEKNPDRKVIIATHSYLNAGGEYKYLDSDGVWNARNCGLTEEGKPLWQQLVSKHENIFLVVSGHVEGSKHCTRTRDGHTVHEMLVDYQDEGKKQPWNDGCRTKWLGDDVFTGNGWMRELTFYPSGKVDAKTLSVLPGVDKFYCNRGSYGVRSKPTSPDPHNFFFYDNKP
jgi:Calcineurin-like phosphoesterase